MRIDIESLQVSYKVYSVQCESYDSHSKNCYSSSSLTFYHRVSGNWRSASVVLCLRTDMSDDSGSSTAASFP
jgi:hypothetical protein